MAYRERFSLTKSGSSIPVLMSSFPITEDIKTKKLALSDYIEQHYPFVPIEILTDSAETIRIGTLDVLQKIFPDQDLQSFRMKQFTDGITNKLFKIALTRTELPPVLVRVYGKNTEMLLDREQEILTMEILWEAGIAQPIYGRFTNGLVYGFAEGQTFSVEDMKCPIKAPLVAQEIARFHGVNVIGSAYREPSVFVRINNWIEVAREAEQTQSDALRTSREMSHLTLEDIIREYEVLYEQIQHILPKCNVCFCHNDLLSKNIIYNEREGGKIEVRFIDYEYGNYNYSAFDIGNHFNEMMGYEVDVNLYPSHDFQIQFITDYVTAYRNLSTVDHALNPNNHLSIDEEVKELQIQVNIFALVSHLFWAIWARVQAVYSEISDFDYYNYAHIRFEAYSKFKNEFLSV